MKYLDRESKVERKDNGNQYTVKVNTATYTVMINRITSLGNTTGLKIRSKSVDLKGSDVKAKFD